MVTRSARLPGIRFEVQPPAPRFILPRMDIAVFVGFAASGPLHVPVAVEDAAHFHNIFGDDIPLAWDGRRGAFEMAYLGSAVRAFFRNGGRRCYVIRVAGPQAQTNSFPVPGLLHADPDGRLEPAYALARSPGNWSDALEVGAETLPYPIRLVDFQFRSDPTAGGQATLHLTRESDLQPGDLLRFNCMVGEARFQLLTVPSLIERVNGDPQRTAPVKLSQAQWKDGRWERQTIITDPRTMSEPRLSEMAGHIHVYWESGRWFRLPGPPSVLRPGIARLYDSSTVLEPTLERPFPTANPSPWVTAWLPEQAIWTPGRPVQLALDLDPDNVPQAASLLEVEFGSERLWLAILSAQAVRSGVPGNGTRDHLVITASGFWESLPPVGQLDQCFVERLRMRLMVKEAGAPAASRIIAGDLGFARAHASFWSALPGDTELFAPYPPGLSNPYASLWKAASQPRFPLTGSATRESTRENPARDEPDYPLPLPIDSSLFAGSIHTNQTALERSGLESFSLDLFLDRLLQDNGVDTLQAQADFLSYQSPVNHEPQGIYAALRLEEATLIAAPDVLHIGWERDFTRPEPLVPLDPPAPDMNCIPPLNTGQVGTFSDRYFLGQPVLTIDPPEDSGTTGAAFRVHWSAVDGPAASYRLEESLSADFTDTVTVYYGSQTFSDLAGRGPGAYYYRVRAEGQPYTSPRGPALIGPWSKGEGIQLGATRPWQTRTSEAFQEDDLARFHTALLTLCAARSDLFALLTLPAFYFEDQALRYAARLQRRLDSRTLSFGALYHPWVYLQQDDETTQAIFIPPDGVICGAIARRTLARGAWLAAANDPLFGVLALEPPIATARLLDLQEGSLNILRESARGPLTLSEQTLSDENTIQPIHVRRLLMLLRRLVQREGANFVFEPNSPAFRRQVQRGLEEVLAGLFQRGAFQGGIPERAYQVDVSDRINPPASLEQGRLIVEIRVAPSQPLAFLTIRLVMSGTSGLQVQEAV